MAADTEVIREFLVSLGFQIDQNGLKKFTGGLAATNSAALTAGKSVLGVAIAAEAMVVRYASSMEKLYFQSRRTDASVESLQSLEFGSRKIGLAAGVARDALEGMVSAARMNPGLRAFINEQLGKNTEGLDQAQVMLDLVQKLSSMPHFQGARYAQMFGIDEKTFLMLKQGMPELIKAEQERRDLNRQAGIDAESAAKAGHEYANSIKDITERVGVLRDKLAIGLLPKFREFNEAATSALDKMAAFNLADHPKLQTAVKESDKSGRAMGGGVKDVMAGIATADGAQWWRGMKSLAMNNALMVGARGAWNWATGQDDASIASRTGSGKINYGKSAAVNPADLFAQLEAKYHLPMGLLDRVWQKESARGQRMRSPVGAMGHFQFMPDTAKEYGLKNPDDLSESADAAARKWSDLLKRYKGDVNKAAAAYNWGDGNLAKYGMGRAPFETRDYAASIAGNQAPPVTITQKTDIHINGADSPAETGRAVALVQDQVTGNMVRNMRGAVQ